MRERRETNSMEPTQLPRTNDSDEAAAILAGLQEKKEAGLLCLYPDCLNERQPSTGKSGRRKGYCSLEEHNITTAFQERQRLKALVEGTAQESSPPAGKGSPTTLKESIISHILHLQEEVPQYLTALREIEDPDLVLSQIQAVEDQASARIADAEGRVSTERSLRLAAEKARETDESAIEEMEEAEERARRQAEEAERQITEIQAEKNRAIDQVQAETQRQLEEIQRQAREAIAQAQTATDEALVQAREADMRANTAETEARERVAAAERLESLANANLERERAEAHTQTERLQVELADTRKQTETERNAFRTEMERLRQDLTDARRLAEAGRSEAHTNLERERAEVGRLRQDLTEERQRTEQVTQRADRLAAVTDELRAQLLQIQTKEKGEPKQQ